MARRARSALPEGLDARHDTKRGVHASVVSLVLLGALMAWGLSGRAGNHAERLAARNADVAFEVVTPGWIRAGEIYEQKIRITALRPIRQLGLAVTPELWREVTVNGLMPEPESQEQSGRDWRFTWKALDAGTTFELKVDAQVNPSLWGRNEGRMAVLDGDRELASVPVAMNVLP